MKFRVMEGTHLEERKDGTFERFAQGSVVTTDVDLVAKFDKHGPRFPFKFQRLPDDYEPDQQTNLEMEQLSQHVVGMAFEDIVTWADAEQLELKGARTKGEALTALRAQGVIL